MKATLPILGSCFVVMSALSAFAQPAPGPAPKTTATAAEQEIVTLSKDKWRWMAERNVEALDKLFAAEAVFVHMGGTMNKSQELETIKSGGIQYKEAQIQEVSVRFLGSTAIDRLRSGPRRHGGPPVAPGYSGR